MEATYFNSAEELRAWLEKHHATATELWIGFYKQATGRRALTWSEVVDEALCFGWIDGKVQRIDEERYRQRLTPRKPTSNWSAINIAKVAAARREDRSAVYSYERRHEAAFDAEQEKAFRANGPAWEWFAAQRPSYRTTATFWVVSAKRPETRERRLSTLIECSAEGRPVPALQP